MMHLGSKGIIIWGDSNFFTVSDVLELNLEGKESYTNLIKSTAAKEATITCSNVQVNFQTLYDLTFFKDSAGLYYDYDLFTLAEILKPGRADEFYRSRVN